MSFLYLGTNKSEGETLLKRLLNKYSQNYKKEKTEKFTKKSMASTFQSTYVLFMKVCEIEEKKTP